MDVQRVWLIYILIALVSVGIATAIDTTTNTTDAVITVNLQTNVTDIQADGSAQNNQPATIITGADIGNYRTRLVLLGTTGGVSWWPETTSASSSSALVVGDTIYLIDLGQGSTSRLAEVFNSGTFVDSPGGKIEDGSSTFLANAKALFFTHLHQDHTADYPSFLLIGPGAGLGTSLDPVTKKTIKVPFLVIGPGNRGQLDADKTNFTLRGGQVIYTDSLDPASITPTPGTRQMTNLIWQAYAQTINDITLDDGYPDFRSLVKVTEIGGSGIGDITLPVSVTDPNNETCPAMDPFEVYSDDLVRVTATLVDHHQVYPSFAYRFDTAEGSVVFSGDTGPDTKGNLQKLADGADLLVHEVIDRAWIDQKFGTPEPGSQMDALKTHMMESHTTTDAVGQVATDCNVNTLVLNHIVPGNTPVAHLQEAEKNFSGKVIIGEDLMQIGIGKAK
jgi:ribonuclease BN (tRNA processing enzyme)